jgi:DNA-binding NtrC family response regulator
VTRAAGRIERDLIDSTLARHHGNRRLTADALGIARKTLFRKIRQHDLRQWFDPDETEE